MKKNVSFPEDTLSPASAASPNKRLSVVSDFISGVRGRSATKSKKDQDMVGFDQYTQVMIFGAVTFISENILLSFLFFKGKHAVNRV